MSQNAAQGPLRARSSRSTEPSLRARIALVPPRAVQSTRVPFAVLIAVVLALGVAGLLLFNTHMQQGAFRVEQLQAEASALSAKQQDQEMQLMELNSPQHIASEARKLGMVAAPNPAFLDLATGKILGVPQAATTRDAINIGGVGIAPTPKSLRPSPKVVIVQPPATNDAKTNTKTTNKTTKNKSQRQTGAQRGAKNG